MVAETTPCLLDIEAQSYPDVDMLERQGEYAFRLRRERRYGRGRRGKYQVVSVLLNLTGAVQPHVRHCAGVRDLQQVELRQHAGGRLERSGHRLVP